MSNNELMHYGVPGMKWGKRKANPQYQAMIEARKNRKQARKTYNKAYNNSTSILQNLQFNKADNQRRATAMMDAAKKYNAADAAYKKAKLAYKNAGKTPPAKQNSANESSKTQAQQKLKKTTIKKKTNTGKKKATKILQSGAKASIKTVGFGAQMATRMMQNNVVYGTTGALFDRIYK